MGHRLLHRILRGASRGEFFTNAKSDRPLLTGSALRIVSSSQGQFVLIDVPVPKTRKDLASTPAMAVSPQSHFDFDPVRLLQAYRERALSMGIHVLDDEAAFKTRDGKPVDRLFMVSTAERLREAVGVSIVDSKGARVEISAASWRAGFVMSSRDAKIVPTTMRANGRWASESGPAPYTVDTLKVFQDMTDAIISTHAKQAKPIKGGHYMSGALLLCTEQGGSVGLQSNSALS